MMGQSDQTLGVSLWDYGSAWQGFHQGQKLHELSIPIVPTNMVICCNSMVYLLNIVISYRNVGLPEGTSHLSQWIPIYIYTIESAVSEKFHWYPIKWTLGFPPHIRISAAGSRIEEVDGIKLYPTHAWKDDMDPILEASGKMEEPRFSPNQTENPWEIFDKQVAFSMFWRGKKRYVRIFMIFQCHACTLQNDEISFCMAVGGGRPNWRVCIGGSLLIIPFGGAVGFRL